MADPIADRANQKAVELYRLAFELRHLGHRDLANRIEDQARYGTSDTGRMVAPSYFTPDPEAIALGRRIIASRYN